AKARARSYRVTCANNQKQIGIADELYESDGDGYLPVADTNALYTADYASQSAPNCQQFRTVVREYWPDSNRWCPTIAGVNFPGYPVWSYQANGVFGYSRPQIDIGTLDRGIGCGTTFAGPETYFFRVQSVLAADSRHLYFGNTWRLGGVDGL